MRRVLEAVGAELVRHLPVKETHAVRALPLQLSHHNAAKIDKRSTRDLWRLAVVTVVFAPSQLDVYKLLEKRSSVR